MSGNEVKQAASQNEGWQQPDESLVWLNLRLSQLLSYGSVTV